jgi:outer membrane murein-binding lipoprotein Lpp
VTKTTQTEVEEPVNPRGLAAASSSSSESDKKLLTKKVSDLESQMEQLEHQVKTQEQAIKNMSD